MVPRGGLPDSADEGGDEDSVASEWKTRFVRGVRLGGIAVALEEASVCRNSGGSFQPLSAFPAGGQKII